MAKLILVSDEQHEDLIWALDRAEEDARNEAAESAPRDRSDAAALKRRGRRLLRLHRFVCEAPTVNGRVAAERGADLAVMCELVGEEG